MRFLIIDGRQALNLAIVGALKVQPAADSFEEWTVDALIIGEHGTPVELTEPLDEDVAEAALVILLNRIERGGHVTMPEVVVAAIRDVKGPRTTEMLDYGGEPSGHGEKETSR